MKDLKKGFEVLVLRSLLSGNALPLAKTFLLWTIIPCIEVRPRPETILLLLLLLLLEVICRRSPTESSVPSKDAKLMQIFAPDTYYIHSRNYKLLFPHSPSLFAFLNIFWYHLRGFFFLTRLSVESRALVIVVTGGGGAGEERFE